MCLGQIEVVSLIFGIKPGHVDGIIRKLGDPLEAFLAQCSDHSRMEIGIEVIGRIILIDDFGQLVEIPVVPERDVVVVYQRQEVAFAFKTGYQTHGIPLVGATLDIGIEKTLYDLPVMTHVIEKEILPASFSGL